MFAAVRPAFVAQKIKFKFLSLVLHASTKHTGGLNINQISCIHCESGKNPVLTTLNDIIRVS